MAEITREELLARYAAGARDFSSLIIHPNYYIGEVIDITDIEDRDSFLAAWDRPDNILRGVGLSDINLSKSGIAASFDGAILRQANLRNAVWSERWNEDIDFTGADITGLSMETGGGFVGCNFTDVIYDRTTSFYHTTFYDCVVDNAFEGTSFAEEICFGRESDYRRR